MKLGFSLDEYLWANSVSSTVNYQEFSGNDYAHSSTFATSGVEFVSQNPAQGFWTAVPGKYIDLNNGFKPPLRISEIVLTQSGNEVFDVNLPSGFRSVGFVFYTNGKPLEFRFLDSAGNTLAETTIPEKQQFRGFIGLSADVDIRKIELRAHGGESFNTGMGPIFLGNPRSVHVSATNRGEGRMDVFAVVEPGSVLGLHWEGNPWITERIRGKKIPAGSVVASVSRDKDNVDLFVVIDGQLWTRNLNVSWGEWLRLDLPDGKTLPDGAPVAVVAHDGFVEAFVVDSEGSVRAFHAGNDFRGWYQIDGATFPTGTFIAATSRKNMQLDLFAIGADGRLWTAYWNGTWTSWHTPPDALESSTLRFPPRTPLTLDARNDEQLDVFGVTEGKVWTCSWNQRWNDWMPLPIPANVTILDKTPIAACHRSPDFMDIFVVGDDGRLHSMFWNGDPWKCFTLDGAPRFLPGAPAAANSRNRGQMDVFVATIDGHVWSNWFVDGHWNSWFQVDVSPYARHRPAYRFPVAFTLDVTKLLNSRIPNEILTKLQPLLDNLLTYSSRDKYKEALLTVLSNEELDKHFVDLQDAALDLGKTRVVHAEGSPALPALGPGIDMGDINKAATVSDAQGRFDDRSAAAVLFMARRSLALEDGGLEKEARARMAFADYFEFDGERLRDEVRAWLLARSPGRTGTRPDDANGHETGKYDGTLMSLVSITYAYYDELRDAAVQNKLVYELLNTRGPLDPNDLLQVISDDVKVDIPETENHMLCTEVARFLTNQFRFRRERLPEYNNVQNGLQEWLLNYLRDFLIRDFIEYNSRPYQDLTTEGLLTLFTYASPASPVKEAAGLVLDYLMAKVATSSNEGRRATTYRRRQSHNGPSLVYNPGPDPMIAWIVGVAGVADPLWNDPGPLVLPDNYAEAMLFAGLCDYRLPEPILDLMLNRSSRQFLQRFHHATDEIYAASPSYLISSGGS